MDIKTVTVLGANGTMGRNVSGIFASFGNAKVYMVCRSLQDAKNAKMKAAKSVRAEVIDKNLIPKTYEDVKECVKESDLIFESVAENMEVKISVYNMIFDAIKPNAIIGTGTSGLSINELSACFDDKNKERYMGIHMYNPPYNMTLCEVIPSKNTKTIYLEKVKAYLRDVLYRDVIEVEDKPAFMGNRIGFQFINEALQYADKYKKNGGIDYIDAILGGFTGRSMEPLVTSDFVGLDVHKAIVDNIYLNTNDYAHETFKMPEFAEVLVSDNKLGRKTGEGLYRVVVGKDGNKVIEVYDIETGRYRKKEKYDFDFVNQMKKNLKNGNYSKALRCLVDDQTIEANICVQFLARYAIYSILSTKSIGENIHSADHAMANGFSWLPPLAVIDAFGGVNEFKKIVIKKLPDEYLSKIDIDEILEDLPKSNYDFRSFLKAK